MKAFSTYCGKRDEENTDAYEKAVIRTAKEYRNAYLEWEADKKEYVGGRVDHVEKIRDIMV